LILYFPKHQTQNATQPHQLGESRLDVSDTWLCFLWSMEYNFDGKTKLNYWVKDKKKYLFEACSRQSDCGECQD